MKTGGVIITGIPTIGRAIKRGEEERREGREKGRGRGGERRGQREKRKRERRAPYIRMWFDHCRTNTLHHY